jgi:hypothetical protein
MVGDSWMRQLYLNFVNVISPTPAMKSFFGGGATGPDRNSHFCKFGGPGPGVDLKRCGWPGNNTWKYSGNGQTIVVEYSNKGCKAKPLYPIPEIANPS